MIKAILKLVIEFQRICKLAEKGKEVSFKRVQTIVFFFLFFWTVEKCLSKCLNAPTIMQVQYWFCRRHDSFVWGNLVRTTSLAKHLSTKLIDTFNEWTMLLFLVYSCIQLAINFRICIVWSFYFPPKKALDLCIFHHLSHLFLWKNRNKANKNQNQLKRINKRSNKRKIAFLWLFLIHYNKGLQLSN